MIAHIFNDLCIGCGDCVTACPTHVLDVGDNGRPVVARLDQCQTCFMCELYCATDAIYVAPEQHQPISVDPAAIRASGHLGRLRRDYAWNGATSEPTALTEFWQLGPLLHEGAAIAARRYAERHANDDEA